MSALVLGWDVGGVNTKVALARDGAVVATRERPFELQRAPDALPDVLRELAAELTAAPPGAVARSPGAAAAPVHAVTMTAELSQHFRTKREGVAFVLDAVAGAFPGAEVHAYTVDGRFLSTPAARAEPLAVAASNWAATARLVARSVTDAILVDIGTTTCDVIPVARGAMAARGRTDPERLAAGELVYTGALRTPVEAIVSEVPLHGELAGVSAEGFALIGDVYLWRGELAADDYTVPTPDGRPATREFAGERLARVVCADRELLAEGDLSAIADHVARAQETRVAAAIRRVHARHPALDTVVAAGLGDWIAARAAARAGLRSRPLAATLGRDAARTAPAAAVALLLESATAQAHA